MTNQELLTNELVRHILGILGLSNPLIPNLIGITFDKFKESSITLDYDDIGRKEFPIYSASTKASNGSIIKVVGAFLSVDEDCELCAIFQCDNFAAHGVKLQLLYNNLKIEESSIFLAHKNNKWENLSTSDKLMACAGFELLNSAGIIWKPSATGEFLHNCLLEIVDM